MTWDGKKNGVVFTLSLLTLFYNTEQLSAAGFKEPPKTWDELKAPREGADARRPATAGR